MPKRKYSEEEARERKNARQREYAQRTHHATDIRSHKRNTRQYAIRLSFNTDADIIEQLDSAKANDGYAGYIKALIRQDIDDNGM